MSEIPEDEAEFLIRGTVNSFFPYGIFEKRRVLFGLRTRWELVYKASDIEDAETALAFLARQRPVAAAAIRTPTTP